MCCGQSLETRLFSADSDKARENGRLLPCFACCSPCGSTSTSSHDSDNDAFVLHPLRHEQPKQEKTSTHIRKRRRIRVELATAASQTALGALCRIEAGAAAVPCKADDHWSLRMRRRYASTRRNRTRINPLFLEIFVALDRPVSVGRSSSWCEHACHLRVTIED